MGHGHSHQNANSNTNILTAFFLNAGFAILELFGGMLTNSMAIYSDALHDLGDSLSLLFSYFASKWSEKEADEKFTFGYKRYSIIAALVNGLILFGGSSYVVYEAVQRLVNPEPIESQGMVVISLVGIAVNGFAAYRLSKNAGLNSKMIMYHLLEDLLGWIAVLIVSIVLLFKPWYILDSVLSILISAVIIRGVLINLYETGKILMQAFPDKINQEEMTRELHKLQHVDNVHFIQGWSVDDSNFNVTLHVRVSPEMKVKEIDLLRVQIQRILSERNVLFSTIQFEGDGCSFYTRSDHEHHH